MNLRKKVIAAVSALAIAIAPIAVPLTAQANENDDLVAETYAEVQNGEKVTFDDASDVARLVQIGYTSVQSDGPISITKGTLKYKKYWWTETKDVYLVCLSGTDTDARNQTTGYWTDLLVGFERDNKYTKNAVKAITSNIPSGSNLIFAGHSLGGMVAQTLAADSTIKKQYNVLNTVTFGSPVIDGLSREGTVKRLGDTSDVIPYMSLTSFTNVVWQSAGLNREDGGYGWDLLGAHCRSYQREAVWGSYDPCGEKNGSGILTLDFSTTHFYHSPVVVTK